MMDRPESSTVRSRAASGCIWDRAKTCFIVIIKIRVGWTSDHIALGTEKVIYVTAFCKPTWSQVTKKGQTVRSRQISRRKRGTLTTVAFVCFGAFASRRYDGGFASPSPFYRFGRSQDKCFSTFVLFFFFLNVKWPQWTLPKHSRQNTPK